MTHEELLKKIGNPVDEGYQYSDIVFNKALRAVVELHKILLVKDYDNDTYWYACQACGGKEYPCETIQAIEKELTNANI